MSLLDKATIITTPTAHSDGVLHSIKGGSVADFDVVRGSAATRVNAEGLIEDVRILSGELVTNGDFANGSTGWTLSSQFSIGTNNAIYDNSASGTLIQNFNWQFGKKYKITFDIGDFATNHRFDIYSGASFIRTSTIESKTSYTIYFNGDGGTILRFRGLTAGSFSVENISVKEVTEDTDIPRIDYTDGTASILLEPQTTNLITHSEDFSQWTAGSDLALSNNFLAPDGTSTAYKVSRTGAATPYLTENIGLTSTTTRSIYARTISGTGTATLLNHNSNTNNIFTLTEQWQRFEINSTASSSGLTTFYAADFRGSGTLTEYLIWGANATNDQDYATSYIPTSGVIATRLADSVTGAGDATTFNDSEGVLYAEIASLADTTSFEVVSLSDGSTSDIVGFVYRNTTNEFTAVVKSGGSTSMSKTITLADATDFMKVAISYKLNEFKFYVNGVLEFTDTLGNTPIGLNTLQLSDGNGTSNKFTGKVKSIITFDTALTDAELECLTTI